MPEKRIICVDCKHFKPLGKKGINGWCHSPKYDKKARVEIWDYCDHAELKEKVSE